MSFTVERPGMMTLVQDLGRWGHQSRGVTVSGPMDQFSLRAGNVMLGNAENDAALEITLLGPEIVFHRECCAVLTGGDPLLKIDGSIAPPWVVLRLAPGSRLAVGGPSGSQNRGVRSYLCVSGGIDVPVVMGSRSTFVRGGLGGYRGRALKAGDVVPTGDPKPLWRASEGFACPMKIRPARGEDEPLYTLDGPQLDAFTDAGVTAFYGETYTVTDKIDRMGYRLDGPEIGHKNGADIISDGIVHGSVQVPGDGKPIVMMSDRQTTGGYAKIATVSTWSAAALAQKMPGDKVRFRRVTENEAARYLIDFEDRLRELDELRASYRSRRRCRGG
jgi:biotin-dependent carboxylase-like uncharacterized protein